MIKFLFISNSTNSNELFIDSSLSDSTINKIVAEAKNIFKQSNKSKLQPNKKNKERLLGGCFYYIVYKQNIFYLIFTAQNFAEELAFDFIDELHKKEIYSEVKGTNGKFSEDSLKKIKKVSGKFDLNESSTSTQESGNPEEKSKISIVQNEVNAAKADMHNNIKKAIINIEEVQIMDEKASKIADSSEVFKNLANDFRRATWWNSNAFKYGLIAIIICIGIFLIYWAFSD